MTHVQHNDIVASRANYRHLSALEMLVTKIFPTIQGEGPYAGWPAIFIRLAGCNRGDKMRMKCSFCDTSFELDQGRRMTFDTIVEACKLLAAVGDIKGVDRCPPLIVLTGGEPMIQPNVVNLIVRLVNDGYRVQMESNGDNLVHGFTSVRECDDVMLVVSPKVSPNGGYHVLKPEVLDRLDYLKVLVDTQDGSDYKQLPPYIHSFLKPVYLSPMAVYLRDVPAGTVASVWDRSLIDHQATSRNYAAAARLCRTGGYRLSMQTHLFCGIE